MEQQLALGVEGGGTKTEWALVSSSDNRTIRKGVLAAANFKLVTRKALKEIFELLPKEADHVGVFLAGCISKQDLDDLAVLARDVWPDAGIAVGSDRESGFATALGDADGILVISGTGSAVTGRKGNRIENAGGWGQLLGDKGGGYNFAVQGLRMALSSYDLERRVTPLGTRILQALSLNRLEDLVNWAMNADKMSVARLAPTIFSAAEEGDTEILSVIKSGADTLADYTAAVAGRLELAVPNVKLMGGLFLNYEEYVRYFKEHLHETLPEARVSVCQNSGALGAAWLAARKTMNAPATMA